MKTTLLLSTLALLLATFGAAAQAPLKPAEALSHLDVQDLQRRAPGRAFEVGGSQFRLVPSAKVPTGDPALPAAAAASPRSRTPRSVAAPSAAGYDAGTGRLAAALSIDGAAVVVTSQVKVYFTDEGAVARAAQASGGRVVSLSRLSRQAIVDYPSVNAALNARTTLLSIAGIRGVEPDIVQWQEQK